MLKSLCILGPTAVALVVAVCSSKTSEEVVPAKSVAPPTSVTVETTQIGDADHPGTKFTVTIANLPSGKKWRDLHLDTSGRRKLPKVRAPVGGSATETLVGPTNSTSGHQTWNVARRNGYTTLVVNTGTAATDPAGHGNGTFSFTIQWDNATFDKGQLRNGGWTATDDGSNRVKSTNTIAVDGSTIKIPQARVELNDGSNSLAAVLGQLTRIKGSTNDKMVGDSYEIYSSIKLNADYTDSLGIGIESTSDPVPATWNIGFQNFTGVLDALGDLPSSVKIDVPNDSALIGKSFYLVLAVKDQGVIQFSSDPITVKMGL